MRYLIALLCPPLAVFLSRKLLAGVVNAALWVGGLSLAFAGKGPILLAIAVLHALYVVARNPRGRRTIRTKVRGVTKSNGDGKDRQGILATCQPGGALRLEREPHNRFDPNAVAVLVGKGMCGYLPAGLAKTIAPLMDKGVSVSGRVLQVTGEGHRNAGMNIELTFADA